MGIKENELADQQAKFATISTVKTIMPGPTYDDFKSQTKEITNNKWLSIWVLTEN